MRLDVEAIDETLARRQGGHGRGLRMQIEHDTGRVFSGRARRRNVGFADRRRGAQSRSPHAEESRAHGSVDGQRGAADQSAPGSRRLRRRSEVSPARLAQRFGTRERARNRDARAPGAICAQVLAALGVTTQSCVARIGDVEAKLPDEWRDEAVEASAVRCPDAAAAERMIAAIDEAKSQGDTLGGAFIVRIAGMPAGIGSNRQPNQRLDGILAGALMGMQTARAVEFGLGAALASTPGSRAHDTFALEGADVVRGSNRAGGIEKGGMSNGEPIVARISVKPIPTLMKALPSADTFTLVKKRRPRSYAATCAWCLPPRSSARRWYGWR